MQQKPSGDQQTSFKYKGQTHQVVEKLRIRGKLYLVVEKKGTRYKAFDVATQAWRSIRLRKERVKYEMNLMQFAKLRNSSLPYTFDYFKDAKNKKEFLVQEWIDGYTLRHYLRRKQGGQPYFSAERSYYLIHGLINGLNRLHERGVFHGDIKPENLIVGDAKRLVMIDFGAAWTSTKHASLLKYLWTFYLLSERCMVQIMSHSGGTPRQQREGSIPHSTHGAGCSSEGTQDQPQSSTSLGCTQSFIYD